jgi:hypothetical protein
MTYLGKYKMELRCDKNLRAYNKGFNTITSKTVSRKTSLDRSTALKKVSRKHVNRKANNAVFEDKKRWARGADWIARQPPKNAGESCKSWVQIPPGPPLVLGFLTMHLNFCEK